MSARQASQVPSLCGILGTYLMEGTQGHTVDMEVEEEEGIQQNDSGANLTPLCC